MMKRIFVVTCLFVGFFGLLITDCTDRFNEHPPETYLTEHEEKALTNKFIVAFHDTLGYGEPMNDKTLDGLREIYRLEYYVKDKDNKYFMVSENRKNLLGSGFTCYAGKLVITQKDTIFQVIFETNSFRDPQGKSTKIQFDSLLLKE